MERVTRALIVAGAVVTLAVGGCGKAGGHTGGKRSIDDGFAIGLLLPENKTARYEAFDKPLIEKYVRAACPKCTVLYQNAQQDAAKQQTQADALLSQGVGVLILDPVDAAAAAGIVERARQQKVPVVAYDRFASGPLDYYVSIDAEKVGEQQATALLEALGTGGDPKRGPIVMIQGAPTDPSSAEYKRGAHRILDGKVEVGFEVDTPDWSPDKAQQAMEQALTKLGASNVIGVYVANDGMASGVIAALKGHGVAPLPPVTGQDAELAAIQRVIAGDQYMTIYAPYAKEAEIATRMAVTAATGATFEGASGVRQSPSGHEVPTVLLSSVAVTRETVRDTVVRDGIYTVAQICTAELQAACKDAGLL